MIKLFKKDISKKIKRAQQDAYQRASMEERRKYNIKISSYKKEKEIETEKRIRDLKKEYQSIIIEKNKEILKLTKQIQNNKQVYNELRERENRLNILAQDLYNITGTSSERIQEAIQPVLKLAAKIEGQKRHSNKKHIKTKNVFELAK